MPRPFTLIATALSESTARVKIQARHRSYMA